MIRTVISITLCLCIAGTVIGSVTLLQLAAGLPVTGEGVPQALMTAMLCGSLMAYLTGPVDD